MTDFGTIAAISTPIGTGGIGIVKISGPDALSIASALFCKYRSDKDILLCPKQQSVPVRFMGNEAAGADRGIFKSHRLYHGHIYDPESGHTVDEVLLTVMKAPHSYTREDVVEIQAHAGQLVLRMILELVLKQGARLAGPGEFTKRAFINGRLDLTQAEAVIDVINARTDKALAVAASHLNGSLKARIDSIRKGLLNTLVELEAELDFPDEVGEIRDSQKQVRILNATVAEPLRDLLRQHEAGHIIRDGLLLIVIGRPNVGKSSLMNRLLEKERVIVTPVPGTTRDLIQESINLGGVPVVVTDTAGLHDTGDAVEAIGIKKTRECLQGADVVVFMVDAACPFTPEDYKIYSTISHKKVILVINKSDLVNAEQMAAVPAGWKPAGSIAISALYNRGLEALKELIFKTVLGEKHCDRMHAAIPNIRHKVAIEKSLCAVDRAVQGLRDDLSPELVVIELKSALDSVGEVTGDCAGEDILEQIFSRFCIGK